MSLTSNINGKTPIGKFLLNSVKLPELHPDALRNPKIIHDGERWSLIGTAFDYLVRMSLASSGRESFEPKIARKALELFLGGLENNPHQEKFSKCCIEVDIAIKENDILTMATHSLSFARLDPYFRALRWDEEWVSKETDQIDARELIKLHELWSESFSFPDGELFANPTFNSSHIVGGADADIIVGTELIDWKVINNPRRGLRKNLAQMVGYALLSHLDGKTLESCTLYFARHGEQLSLPFEQIMVHPIEETVSSLKEIADQQASERKMRIQQSKKKVAELRKLLLLKQDVEHILPDEKRCTAISKSSGERCKAHRKRDSDRCHTHTPKVIIAIDQEEEKGLIEMLLQTPNLPDNFWRNTRYGLNTTIAEGRGLAKWINSFPDNHPMRRALSPAIARKTEISRKLIIHCTPGVDYVDAFLIHRDVSPSDYRTKWDKFWKAHELATDSETL